MSGATISDSWSLRRQGETTVGFFHSFHDTVGGPLCFHWKQIWIGINENEKG